jgi:phage/plasmid primase-like uncharacterized protein
MTSAAVIIKALGGSAHTGMCRCPAHDDSKPSLHVVEKSGKVLYKCFAGCSQAAVTNVLRGRHLLPKKSATQHAQQLNDEVEQGRRAEQDQAAIKAKHRWRNAQAASSLHPYLAHKGVAPDGLKMEAWHDGRNPLLVPLYDEKGKLRNLQLIYVSGEKRFLRGGQVKNTHYWISRPEDGESNTICIAEGLATGKSAFDASQFATIVSFGKGNLLAVAKWVRDKYHGHKIVVLADDDGGDGVEKAHEAARAVTGLVAVPEFGKERQRDDADFNDLAQCAGLREVKRQINAAVEPDPAPERDPDEKKGETQALTLVMLAPTELFRTKDQVGYADIIVNGQRETWPINSTGFKLWLMHQYWAKTQRTASSEAVRQALEMIEAKARFDAGVPVREVFVRVGHLNGKIYIDLCDEGWRAVEVAPEGWRVVDQPPVRFRRAPGMLPLPEPQHGGSVEELRPFINVKAGGNEKKISDKDFVLVVAWLLAAFSEGPFPILKVWGEPGAAKSTLTEVLRSLVDPHKVTRRRLPREERDLFIAANNAWALTYDNLSQVPEWLSNALCTMATGGGFATRALYKDHEEQLFDAKRPVIINGVENFITKHDLADRTILLELPFIPADERQREREFKDKFEARRPRILGALLDVVAHGLRAFPEVPEEDWPRMADFAHWITACESALWEPGTFRKAYDTNRKKATQSAIDDDLVATALRGFINEDESEWTGTTAELLNALTERIGEKQAKEKDWPQTPRALTGRLEKARGGLRLVGITIEQAGRTNKGRVLKIKPNLDDVRRSGKDRHNRHDRHFDRNHKAISRDGSRDGRRDDRPTRHSASERLHADTRTAPTRDRHVLGT